jgi:hypothetical protein
MNQQALEFVMNMYQVDRVTALQLYWDEIEAAERLINKGLIAEESDDEKV